MSIYTRINEIIEDLKNAKRWQDVERATSELEALRDSLDY